MKDQTANHDPRPTSAESLHEPDATRRQFALALMGLLGGGTLAAKVEALPLTAKLDFLTVNRLLAKYGISLGGYEDRAAKRDVIEETLHPREDTEYVSTIELPNDRGAVIPCIRVRYFDETSDFYHLMPSPVTGQLVTCFHTHIEHEHAHGLVIPCISEHYDATGQRVLLRAAVVEEHEEAHYTVHDATAAQDSAAPLRVESRWDKDGSVSAVRAVVSRSDLPFAVDVAGTRYVLAEGRLVQQE